MIHVFKLHILLYYFSVQKDSKTGDLVIASPVFKITASVSMHYETVTFKITRDRRGYELKSEKK